MPDQLTQNQPRDRASFLRAGLFGILAACGAALAATGTSYGLFAHFGISQGTSDYILGVGVGLLLAAALVSLLTAKYRRDYRAPENRIDQFQTQQRRILVAITILVAGFGLMAIFHPFFHAGAVEKDFAIEFTLLAFMTAAVATFGVGFLRRSCRTASNDELARALRARATKIGYILAMLGLSASYMLSIFRPDLTIVALPVALLAGAIAPTGYFLIADWHMNSDG